MKLQDLSTRELIERLAGLEDEVRATPSHVADGDGGTRLNPHLEELAREELEVLRTLRARRERAHATSPLSRLLAPRTG